MVDLANAKASDVGESSPKDSSKEAVDNIVNDVLSDAKISESPNKQPDGQPEPDMELDGRNRPKEKAPKVEDEPAEEVVEEKVEDADEDLIPKSKIQPRIDELVAKNKALEAEIQKRESKPPATQDEKLNRLSVAELKQLRRQTKLAQRTETDEARLEQLLDLEEKIEDSVANYPMRFQQRQADNLKAVLPELAKIDPEIANGKGELWNIATQIYQRSGALRGSEMGQVEAAILAAEHFNLKASQSNAKDENSTLSKQVTNLKRKTSLEGKTRVASDKGTNITKLREKARTGNLIDKENFFREALVPDEFIQI